MSKVVLITGATGKQGGAVVDALLESPEAQEFTILAVTRNPDSPSAQKLKNRDVKIVTGDLNDVPSIFKNAKTVVDQPIWGVFSVQVPMGKGASGQTEEAQGKALVDGAVTNGVKMFVYTSVDRGGDEKSPDNPTEVPHFINKYNIEKHLVEKAKVAGMDWCILRPVAFMDNMTPDFMGKGFATMWKVGLKEKRLQLIALSDIGHFAAQAFIHPEEYKGQGIGLAGDDLSFAEASKIFMDKTGQKMPTTFAFLAYVMLWAIGDLGAMFKWFNSDGYGVKLEELRKRHPGLLNFGDWLEKKSKFEMKK